MIVLGIDTSCYTTSVAAAGDQGILCSNRQLLPVAFFFQDVGYIIQKMQCRIFCTDTHSSPYLPRHIQSFQQYSVNIISLGELFYYPLDIFTHVFVGDIIIHLSVWSGDIVIFISCGKNLLFVDQLSLSAYFEWIYHSHQQKLSFSAKLR